MIEYQPLIREWKVESDARMKRRVGMKWRKTKIEEESPHSRSIVICKLLLLLFVPYLILYNFWIVKYQISDWNEEGASVVMVHKWCHWRILFSKTGFSPPLLSRALILLRLFSPFPSPQFANPLVSISFNGQLSSSSRVLIFSLPSVHSIVIHFALLVIPQQEWPHLVSC